MQEVLSALQNLPFGIGSWAIFGCVVLYVLNRQQGKQPFSLLVALNVSLDKQASPGVGFIDLLVSSIIGGVLVTALTSPTTTPQAIIAGLGLTGILSAYSEDIS